MTTAIAERTRSVHPDEIQGKAPLHVVPILGKSHREPKYRLLDRETLAGVKITEVSEHGSVPELKIENTLDVHVFLMDGQELIGAKQNRILNTDVLVPPKTTIKIPVSCVEAGRWHYSSADFQPGKAASCRIRSGKQERVSAALRREGRHDAEQGEVWNEVRESLAAARCESSTAALHDAYEAQRTRLSEFRSALRLPKQAVGVAVFHGSRFQGMDIFDRNSTLRYFWESLVDSYAIDWLDTPVDLAGSGKEPEAAIIGKMLEQAAGGKWEGFHSPGAGQDYRLEDETLTGSALIWQEQVVIHLQLFPKQSNEQQNQVSHRHPRIHRPYVHRC